MQRPTQQRQPVYDRIGDGYAVYRVPDPRIAAAIAEPLGGATSVLDVGSGTGSYEPAAASVTAIEPSWTMIRQRPEHAAPVACAVAEHLPFPDNSFDAATAILTVHHWSDYLAGLAEMQRVARRQVVLTWDREVFADYWLIANYLPEIGELERDLPSAGDIAAALGSVDVRIVEVPWDCTDGFCAAYWRRPERYLEAGARAAISGFARCDPADVARAVRALDDDLTSGRWDRRFGRLRRFDSLDCGYRLVVGGA